MSDPLQQGIACFREGRFAEALAHFEALPGEPTPKLRYTMARCRLQLGQREAARAAFAEVATAQDPGLVEAARRALAELGPRACPRCEALLPPEDAAQPWCACGYGRRPTTPRLYFGALLAYCASARLTVELKRQGDLYAVEQELRLKHLSDGASRLDPRSVFRSDRGWPYLLPEDLLPVMPKVDDRALFRLRKGNELGAGKLVGWPDLLQRMREQGVEPGTPPEDGLGGVLVAFGGLPRAVVARAEAERGPGTLGSALVLGGAVGLQALLAAALGPSRVFAPGHHHGQQLAWYLLEQGAIELATLHEVLIAQVRQLRPLPDLLRGMVVTEALRAAQARVAQLAPQGPELDRLGEVLVAAGRLSRTDLASALQEHARTHRPSGQILVERGFVTAEQLADALARQATKRELRLQGPVRLGEVLVAQGALSRRDLARTLIAQLDDPRPLGELLVARSLVPPERLMTALAEQEAQLELEAAQQHEQRATEPAAASRALTGELTGAEDEDDPEPGRLPWKRFVVGAAGLMVLVGLVAQPLLAPTPPLPSPPLLARAPVVVGQEDDPYAGFGGRRVEVDLDQVLENVEKGVEDPVGAAMHGAYRAPIPSSVLMLAERTLAAHEAQALPSRVASLARPVADEEEIPAVEERSVEEVMSRPEGTVQGDRLLAAGRASEALVALQGASKVAPGDRTTLARLASAQLALQQPTQAIATLERALARHPADATLAAALGGARLAAGQGEAGLAAYRSAVTRAPRDAVLRNRLGLVLRQQGLPDQAADAFREALKLDPANPRAHYNLAQLQAPQNGKAAREHYLAAMRGFATEVEARVALGEALKAQGDGVGALRSFDGALRSNALLAESQLAMGRLLVLERRKGDARRYFAAAGSTYPTSAVLHVMRGDALLGLGQSRGAIAEYVVAARLAPRYAAPYVELGRLAAAAGQVAAARRYFGFASLAEPRGADGERARSALRSLRGR